MVKKGKKDEKGQADDYFDILNIESRHAGTVVLLLSSTEEEVQAKACEAIYIFAKKCKENIKYLFELNTIEYIMTLLKSDKNVIKRNAIMVLGILTEDLEVCRYIAKYEENINIITKLLSPEEFSVTIEFATFCLTNLCKESTMINILLEHNIMEPLIEGIKNDEPDIKNNSVQCLSIILQDFEARSLFRDCNGFESLLELLESEYNLIQKTALQCFIQLSYDAGNRTVIRDMEILRNFVEIIGKSNLNDLHTSAIQVLHNCWEDTESIQLMKESGSLLRFIAFITDSEPVEEEIKADKGKKKGGSGKKKKEDKKSEDSTPSQTMPDVKKHALNAIMHCSKNNENRKLLHEIEIEKTIILLLNYDDENVKIAAAKTLAVLAENSLCQNAISKFEGINPLIKLLKVDNIELKEACSLALSNLTVANMNNCHEISEHHGIECLIECLHNKTDQVISNALTALCNLSIDDNLRSKALDFHIIKALISTLNKPSNLVKKKSALAVASFVCDQYSYKIFTENSGLIALSNNLSSLNEEVRKNTCWTIAVLSNDNETANELYSLGVFDILKKMNQSESLKNTFTEIALMHLLDCNISSKYSSTGILSYSDRIPDIFYDPGKLKENSKLLSLASYAGQKVNSQRPILLINVYIQNSKESSNMEGINLNNDDEIKSFGNKKVLDYMPNVDLKLLEYLKHVKSFIEPLQKVQDQVVVLSCFVAEKMGGPIQRGQIMFFEYELPISQLKFQLKSNIVPLGLITKGIYYHRALLFKFLADNIGIGVTLHRGEHNRAWNQILLVEDSEIKFPPSTFIIDLMHEPGKLIKLHSIEAENYMKI